LAKSGALENKILRSSFIGMGILLALFIFALPFFQQPNFHIIAVNYYIGVPLALFGLVARVYPMIYLRKRGTTTALNEVTSIVDSGPYGIVRHPQYVGGILLIIGWFIIWGAINSLYLVPLIILLTIVQAYVEEKYILTREFGEAYQEYRKRVGMLLPNLRRCRRIGRSIPEQVSFTVSCVQQNNG
jgi:protein-S-isoprenylcysteine O-methyltransferase Ste14